MAKKNIFKVFIFVVAIAALMSGCASTNQELLGLAHSNYKNKAIAYRSGGEAAVDARAAGFGKDAALWQRANTIVADSAIDGAMEIHSYQKRALADAQKK